MEHFSTPKTCNSLHIQVIMIISSELIIERYKLFKHFQFIGLEWICYVFILVIGEFYKICIDYSKKKGFILNLVEAIITISCFPLINFGYFSPPSNGHVIKR